MNCRAMRLMLRRVDRGLDLRAERDVLGRLQTEVERGRQVDALEVLREVPDHVVVVRARREDVDEAEELRPEVVVGHRPVEEAVGPPRHVVDARAFGRARLGDLAGERSDVILRGDPRTPWGSTPSIWAEPNAAARRLRAHFAAQRGTRS